ncbi:acetyltransferase, N-acetylglutamate synthase [Xenococcus sp. PCC 7305]|uniref:GNAT family N-acetyltransferase n=1 Tax=Xenococcus sp. PCC 7305 TaxID=102125 RepID=UPI0002ACA4BE|nr:GNAT family N-acetyltransferase [Xenococcus sp. PCC 7305]ELS05536.1 acetyltransferase, N-acetylglutamate synthase [Xenococcus sp. PCC 7305]
MEQENNHKISIRSARPADSDAIVQLQLLSIETLCAQDYNKEQLQAFLKSKSCPRYWDEKIFIAEIDQTIVGFAALQKYSHVITAMFVHPLHIRKKVGTTLLLHVEQVAMKKRTKKLLVYSSLTGKNFYARNGFTTICEYNILLENMVVFPSIKMSKQLLTKKTTKSSSKVFDPQSIQQKSILQLLLRVSIPSITMLLVYFFIKIR